MKVQCGQCPAKYSVSDERIHDKKVRIHCKRCGAAIIVDGKVNPPLVTSTPARRSARPTSPPGPPDNFPALEREPDSRPSPRPVAHTIMGGLEAPIAERLQRSNTPYPADGEADPDAGERSAPATASMPAQNRGLTDPPSGAQSSRWRVALTKQDLRWMTTSEIVEAFHTGAVKLETFVFRAGMPTWVTLPEVPELVRALADAGEELGISPSSLPPPRSPSSQPPPRKPHRPPAGDVSVGPGATGVSLDELELGEPMPFALVAERSSGVSQETIETLSDDEIRITTAPDAPHYAPPPEHAGPHEVGSPEAVSLLPPAPEEHHPSMVPFAAAQQASGSSRWVWVVVVVLVLAAAAAVIGPRLGLKLL